MIGTIRKHSGWLWAVIITATIVSFIFWGTSGSKLGNGGGATGDLGTVYGKKVTPDALAAAQKNFYISYWFRSGNWPDRASMTKTEIDQQSYLNLMLAWKAEKMGIHVSEDAVAAAASERLRAIGRNGQAVPLDSLMQQVLGPAGFSITDFEHYVRNELIVEQLVRALGLPGQLITPQEATAAYQHDHEQLATEGVFFSATNYLTSVKPTEAIIGQFYTNYQAEYRLPDRVQVNYVVFDATNYMAQSRAEWAKTNFDEVVAADLQRAGDNYKGSKTPAEAKAKVTEELVEARAAADAKKDADAFASDLFAIDPAKAENLAVIAGKRGVAVHQTAPFAKATGPDELEDSANFAKTAFDLTSDIPVAGPVRDGNSFYIMALTRMLPSEVPSFAEIHERVTADYQQREAILMAQRVGQVFYQNLTNQMAGGKTFPAACVAAGRQPLVLAPFSISTEELPDLSGVATVSQIKQAAFTTAVGQASKFEPTQDGGFILYVQSRLPVDQSTVTADLPQFTARLRQTRLGEAFNEWVQSEAGSALRMPKEM